MNILSDAAPSGLILAIAAVVAMSLLILGGVILGAIHTAVVRQFVVALRLSAQEAAAAKREDLATQLAAVELHLPADRPEETARSLDLTKSGVVGDELRHKQRKRRAAAFTNITSHF